MSTGIDLGHLDLESESCDLQLQLSGSAKVAPSAEDEIDELQRRLTVCRLNPDSTCRPWISRGSSFRLILNLQVETELKRGDQITLIETLSTQLRVAKVAYS